MKEITIFLSIFMALTNDSWARQGCTVKLKFHNRNKETRTQTFVKSKLDRHTTRMLIEQGHTGKTTNLETLASLFAFSGDQTLVHAPHRLAGPSYYRCENIKLTFAEQQLQLYGSAIGPLAFLAPASAIIEGLFNVFTLGAYLGLSVLLTGKLFPMTDRVIFNQARNSHQAIGEMFGAEGCNTETAVKYLEEGSYLKCPRK